MAKVRAVRLGVPATLLVLAALTGCGRPRATLLDVAADRRTDLTYDSATFQLARGRRVEVVLFRQISPGVGRPDPDFEYVYFDLPEDPSYGWVPADDRPVWRWVHEDGADRVWRGASGHDTMSFLPDRQYMGFGVNATFVPRVPEAGPTVLFDADLSVREDILRTQGLINHYGSRLAELIEAAEGKAQGGEP